MQYTSVKIQKKVSASVNKKGEIYAITTQAESIYHVNSKTMFLFRPVYFCSIFIEVQ